MEFIKNLYKQVRSFFARTLSQFDRAASEAIVEAGREKTGYSYFKAITLTVVDLIVAGLFGRLVGFVLGTIFCTLFGVAGVLIALPLAIWFILDTFAEVRKMRTEEMVEAIRNKYATA